MKVYLFLFIMLKKLIKGINIYNIKNCLSALIKDTKKNVIILDFQFTYEKVGELTMPAFLQAIVLYEDKILYTSVENLEIISKC